MQLATNAVKIQEVVWCAPQKYLGFHRLNFVGELPIKNAFIDPIKT
jgi:hypothetical protein